MIHLNGEFMRSSRQKSPSWIGVSFSGRGLRGDPGVFPAGFRLEEHLARLQASLDAIRLANPHPLSKWTELVGKIIAEIPGMTRMSISRSPAARPSAITPSPRASHPRFSSWRASWCPRPRVVESGAKAIVLPDFPLAALRHQVDLVIGQLHAAQSRGGSGLRGGDPGARRPAHRSLGEHVFIVKNGTVLALPSLT